MIMATTDRSDGLSPRPKLTHLIGAAWQGSLCLPALWEVKLQLRHDDLVDAAREGGVGDARQRVLARRAAEVHRVGDTLQEAGTAWGNALLHLPVHLVPQRKGILGKI